LGGLIRQPISRMRQRCRRKTMPRQRGNHWRSAKNYMGPRGQRIPVDAPGLIRISFRLACRRGRRAIRITTDRALARLSTTNKQQRCLDGYELVIRANGRRGCAKDVVPASD
jgi:hypothetical protein